MTFQAFAGSAAIVVELLSMLPYYHDIFRGTTKPHIFTWFGWGLITAITAAAQYISGAGPSAYVSMVMSAACFGVAVLAILWGEKEITKGDWACLIGSLLATLLWVLTSEPLIAVVIVCVADILAYIPTIRKAFYKPHEETLATFGLGTPRDFLAICALNSFAIVNWLYPVTLLVSDSIFVAMLVLRRRSLDTSVANQ